MTDGDADPTSLTLEQSLAELCSDNGVIAYSTRLAGNAERATDLVSEACVHALAHADKHADFTANNVRAWFFSIIRNVAFREEKKRRRGVALEEFDAPADCAMRDAEAFDGMCRALREVDLTSNESWCIKLYYFDDWTLADIGLILNHANPSVLHKRALQKLAGFIE